MMLVTGAGGFVGGKLMQQCREAIACPSLRQATEEDVRRIVEESGTDTIVHTAAIADIGVCEKHPDASYRANVQLPVWLAKAAQHRKLICFSVRRNGAGRALHGGCRQAEQPLCGT